LPIDATLDNAADVNPFRLVRIDSVMETLNTVRGAKIVVLDACRDNPVEGELKRKVLAIRGTKSGEVTRGLGEISADGLLIAYATQPNKTALDGKGRNSPFSAAFVKNVGDPDIDVRAMFFRVQDEVDRETDHKQRPELSISLVGEYKLKITVTPVKSGETAPPVVQVPSADLAEREWNAIKDTSSVAMLEEFIREHGSSIYARYARARLEELKKNQVVIVDPKPPVPSRPFSNFPAAGPEAAAGQIREFVIRPVVAGKVRRSKWIKAAADRWIEIGDNNARYEFNVVTRIVLNHCPGTVVKSIVEKKYSFIPDRGCPGMVFFLSYDGEAFGPVSEMTDIL